MAYFDTARTAPFGAITTFRALTGIERAAAAFRAWNMARKTEAQLARLSDHELEDIGLHRGSISDVAHDFSRF